VGKKERNTHREIGEIEVKGGDTERSGVSGGHRLGPKGRG